MTKNRSGNFTRDPDRESVQTILDRDASYTVVLSNCLKALQLTRELDGKVATLLSPGGAVIPLLDDWTLREYMKQLHRSPSSTRFGLGYIKKVCVMYNEAVFYGRCLCSPKCLSVMGK